MTVAARITCETLPGLLRDFRTASDKSCGRGLGTRLGSIHTNVCMEWKQSSNTGQEWNGVQIEQNSSVQL